MKFAKMHGAGNDFILVDARGMERDWASLARALCHRHLGVGAAGLLLVVPSLQAALGMRMFNPDGSEAEACGNGMRCFAKYAVEKGLVGGAAFPIETRAGLRQMKPRVRGGKVVSVQVTLGRPSFAPQSIPMRVEGELDIIKDYPLMVGRRRLPITALSLGNPHAVHFWGRPVAEFPLSELGPQVEHHPAFPQRVNFEVARVLGPGRVEARVWERGAGETMACGSGAGAIAVAARLLGYGDGQVDITLPGGTLRVGWDGEGEVTLSGPAEFVFEGEWRE
ncbi:MAG: diaminopimelate epimerase [Chloroflexota bacterium]|nr:diaminopimelate epimerase [Chloroflexota bacterium]